METETKDTEQKAGKDMKIGRKKEIIKEENVREIKTTATTDGETGEAT